MNHIYTGKGEWRNISSYYVPTKTPSQVASHGQKYFRRLKCVTPLEKRRYSIHDIRILNSSIVETSPRHPNRHSFISHIPKHDNHPSNFNDASSSSSQVITTTTTTTTTVTTTTTDDCDNNISPTNLASSDNYSELIMGHNNYDNDDNNDNNMDQYANGVLLSPASNWFPQESHDDEMPFNMP
ncbi:Transcription factor DIVARICATA [Bienertia sinuspersici]